MEKKMENEMETLGPFKGVYRDIWGYIGILPCGCFTMGFGTLGLRSFGSWLLGLGIRV